VSERKQNRKKLEEYSQGLELTVAARTQELRETHDRLLKAERFAAIGELAGMVGHDLRNPLTSIKNAAYYLNRKQGCSTEAKQKEMLEVIDLRELFGTSQSELQRVKGRIIGQEGKQDASLRN
jgi:signal transduction histidine kinase